MFGGSPFRMPERDGSKIR